MLLPDRNHKLNTEPLKTGDVISSICPENDSNNEGFSDNRIHIKQGKQTVRMTVTITSEQRRHLRSLSDSSGFNASELVR